MQLNIKEKCSFKNCDKKAKSLIRGKFVCNRHYNILKDDNFTRVQNDMTLPTKLNLLDLTKEKFKHELDLKYQKI